MLFPSLSEYQIAISKYQSQVICFGEGYQFIPSMHVPIKIYTYGSGTFATVFKLQKGNQYYALRCFLSSISPQQIKRIKEISRFLYPLQETWVCKYVYYEQGIQINSTVYPAIVMEWSHGIPLYDYVSSILHTPSQLSALQHSLYTLSESLSTHQIAHGDIQSGNILVETTSERQVVLKLIDYDAFYTPSLRHNISNETGHTSFQHPQRKREDCDERINRFSFWLILTALEALKFDKSLWNKDLQGGFNDEDNFLFKAKDLQHPQTSALIKRLHQLNQPSVEYYIQNLFQYAFYPFCDAITLYTNTQDEQSYTTELHSPMTRRTNRHRPKRDTANQSDST